MNGASPAPLDATGWLAVAGLVAVCVAAGFFGTLALLAVVLRATRGDRTDPNPNQGDQP